MRFPIHCLTQDRDTVMGSDGITSGSSSTTQRYLLFSEDSRRPRYGSLHLSTLY